MTGAPVTVVALVGSAAVPSTTGALVRALAALAPRACPGLRSGGVTVDVAEVLAELPIFVPDRPAAPSVVALQARLAAADAVVICTPECAYGMPGALKNALDWLVGSGELYGKPVAALSASPSERGGDRALQSLRQTLQALGAVVPEAATFAIPFARQALSGAALPEALADQTRAALDALLAARPARRGRPNGAG